MRRLCDEHSVMTKRCLLGRDFWRGLKLLRGIPLKVQQQRAAVAVGGVLKFGINLANHLLHQADVIAAPFNLAINKSLNA